jgi:hypothetical protein
MVYHPVKLDARLSFGSAVDFSEASIVVRHVRFSGQIAPRDQYTAARDYGSAAGRGLRSGYGPIRL